MDHESVNISTTSMSCGVLELNRISEEVEKVLYAIGTRLYHPSRGSPAAFIVWSHVAEDKTASKLATAIQEAGLGHIGISVPMENPKTGNFICIYTWAVVHERFKDWYAQKRVEKMAKVGA